MFPNFNNSNSTGRNNNTNTLLRGNSEQASETYAKMMLSNVQQLQDGRELGWMSNVLANQYRQIINSLEQSSKVDPAQIYDEEFNQEVKQRVAKLSKKNLQIAIQLFNFKQNLMRVSSRYSQRDTNREAAYYNVQENMKRVKMEINAKLQKLKANRLERKTKPKKTLRNKRAVGQAPVLRLALTELKDAVEVVNKQLLKQRQEMKILLKDLYNQTV